MCVGFIKILALECIIDELVLFNRKVLLPSIYLNQYFFASPLLHLSNDLIFNCLCLMIMEEIKNMVQWLTKGSN